MFSTENRSSLSDLPKFIFNSVVKLLVFLKNKFKWVLHDSKGNLYM